MIKCPFCGTTHVANTLFCSECGTYLLEDDRRGTDPLGTDEIGWVGEEEEEAEAGPLVKGTGPLAIRLRIGESGREVEATLNKAIHLGRLDPASDVFPEIDLTNDNGLERGVSRRHARILKLIEFTFDFHRVIKIFKQYYIQKNKINRFCKCMNIYLFILN